MSVWKSTVYRDNTFQWFARNLPPASYNHPFIHSVCNFEVEEFGEFPVPHGLRPGNLKDQVVKDHTLLARIASFNKANPHDGLAATLDNLPDPMFGLHGCYKFINRVWASMFEPGEKLSHHLAQHLVNFGLTGAGHSKGDFIHRLDTIKKALNESDLPVRSFIRGILILKQRFKTDSVRLDQNLAHWNKRAIPLERVSGIPQLAGWYYLSFRGTLFLIDPFKTHTYVLTGHDFERVEKFLLGCAAARIYSALYGMLGPDDRDKLVKATVKWQNLAVEIFGNVDRKSANLVCRAFDVAYNVVLAGVAADVSKRAKKDQQDKFTREGLSQILNLDAVNGIVSRLAFKEQLEVLQQYKLFPVADFDYFGMLYRQHELYKTRRQVAGQFWDTLEHESLMRYYKWMMIVSFYNRHGHCPGHVVEFVEEKKWHDRYPNLHPAEIDPDDVGDIDLAGSFKYNTRGTDNLDLVKDKAICPDNVRTLEHQTDLNLLSVKKKSQLVDAMSRTTPLNTIELWNRFDTLMLDAKADDKPEAKKPNGRMFFELGTEARLCISEYEDSVAEYAKYTPGVTAGVSAGKVTNMMNKCTAPMPDAIADTPLFISFDLEKWSPTFQAEAHVKMDLLWAEAFGKPDLLKASKIFSEGEVHYIKGRIHHKFKKLGNEYEGHFARKGSIYHASVMGWTVRRLRKQEVLNRGGHFSALLDDGLLRVTVPTNQVHSKIQPIMDGIEQSYKLAGYYLSWDKTHVSSRFAIFLNEIRVDGRSYTPGLKSILKISNRSEAIAPSLLSDIEHAGQVTRGAISAGATPVGAYVVYVASVVDAIRRWCKIRDSEDVSFALRAFLPGRALGMGVASLSHLAGSLVGDALIEAYGVLRAIGFRYPELKQTIRGIVNEKFAPISPQEAISNPLGIRTEERGLRSDRGNVAVERHLFSTVRVPLLEPFLNRPNPIAHGADIVPMRVKGRFPVELRTRLFSSSLSTLILEIVGKFQKSKSALYFVPIRVLFRAVTANKTEALRFGKRFSNGTFDE